MQTDRKRVLLKGAETVLYILLAVLVAFLIIRYIGQRTVVDGDSMYPTLKNGDNLIVNKIGYRLHDPKRFDVIVFPYKEPATGKEVYYIKRIIGMPGEEIQIIGNDIYINGEKLEENYGSEKMQDAGYAAEPVRLLDDEYFVLGDNRNVSKDSRHLDENGQPDVGSIKRSDIIGKAVFCFWPSTNFGKVK